MKFSEHDKQRLRRLAERKAQLAHDPINLERRQAWYSLDAGRDDRPMILMELGGLGDDLFPYAAERLICEHDHARQIERLLLHELYQFDVIRDDHVVEPVMDWSWRISVSNYGVQAVRHQGRATDSSRGSWKEEPPIRDLDSDFGKLKPRTFSVDRPSSIKMRDCLEDVFEGILDVRCRAKYYWTMGLTMDAIHLVGLENLMLFMFDDPTGLHQLMAFLRDQHLAMADWLEAEGLLTLNNENDYIGSGSMGYTRDLPRNKRRNSAPVSNTDCWVLLESQETVGVGPEQYEEFIFPYEQAIAQRFGKVYYGCCEPVHNRWDILKAMPNLARVSISPWCNQEVMAQALERDYVFSRKPNPTLISTAEWDETALRRDLRQTLSIARDNRVEIIMKDVHTLHNEVARAARWVAIAREEAAHFTKS